MTQSTSKSSPSSGSPQTDPKGVDPRRIDGTFGDTSSSSDDALARSSNQFGASNSSTARLWFATIIAGLVAIPLSILLSFGAALPFFLGLFFFALFGLIIGAAGFRAGQKYKPYSRRLVITVIAIIIGWCTGISLTKEAVDFPSDMASQALAKTRNIGDRSSDQYLTDVANEVRTMLKNEYPPGGFVGYFKWVTTNGTIKKDTLPSVERGLKAGYSRILWFIRLLLSTALLTFGVASQMMLLARPAANSKK